MALNITYTVRTVNLTYEYKGNSYKIQPIINNVIGSGGTIVVVDDAMSDVSENPVQNKVVKNYIDSIGAGQDGLSAYEVWLANGNTGTEQEYLDSLQGADGADGAQGEQGEQGEQGIQGIQGEQGIQGIQGIDGVDANVSTISVDSVTGTHDIDWGVTTHEVTMTGATVFSDINYPSHPTTITIHLTGDFGITLPASWDILGTSDYDGTVVNILALDYYNNGTNDIVRGTLTPIA